MEKHTTTYEEFKKHHYRENGRRVKQALQEKAMRGELPGPAPLGYITKRDSEGKSIEIDEEVAPLIRSAFEMAAQDDMPLRKILQEITEAGLRSRNGKPLGVSGLWYMLTNPFYVGLVRHDGKLIQGRHEPVVDTETFNRMQAGLFKRKRLLDK